MAVAGPCELVSMLAIGFAGLGAVRIGHGF
jgi:hypothetical protein